MAKIDIPPVWLVILIVVAYVISGTWSWPGFSMSLALAGGMLVVAGLGLTVWAVRTMTQSKTTIIPRRDPSGLVTTGPFRFSRNPIYLSDAMVLAGLCLIFGSVAALVTVPVFVALIQLRFIHDEERRLQRGFPNDFAEWKAATRRWI